MTRPRTRNLSWSFSRGAILRALALLVVLWGAALGLVLVLEIPFAPWIRSFGLWPTLTGAWVGELRTPDGRTSAIFFDLRGAVRRHSSNIDGTARWCDGGAIREYEIHGDPDDWLGTRFHLSTRIAAPDGSAVRLGDLQGERDGDEIRAVGVLVAVDGAATAALTRTSKPEPQPRVHYVLRRGGEGEFLAACGGQAVR